MSWRTASLGLGFLLLALTPSLLRLPAQGERLLAGLPPEQMRVWAALVQSPQHLLPHLWRLPQWLAWACFPLLAGLSLNGGLADGPNPARRRLGLLLCVNLAGLGLAWVLVEPLGHLKVTLFQPFRLATVARGLRLVLASGRWVAFCGAGAISGGGGG